FRSHQRGFGNGLGQLGGFDLGAHAGDSARLLDVRQWLARRLVTVASFTSRVVLGPTSSAVALRAASTSSRCSVSWILEMPVAGAAACARPAYSSVWRSFCKGPSRRWRIWYQAPWFCGSSWHQTICRALG